MMRLPVVNVIATGEKINQLRLASDMTVKDMQIVFGFYTPQAIYKWIHGSSMPTIDNLVILSRMFGVSLDDIVVIEFLDIGDE